MIEVVELDVNTGEITERSFTDEELRIRAEGDKGAQAVADREAAKASALAKLEALGLTADEAQAIAGI